MREISRRVDSTLLFSLDIGAFTLFQELLSSSVLLVLFLIKSVLALSFTKLKKRETEQILGKEVNMDDDLEKIFRILGELEVIILHSRIILHS